MASKPEEMTSLVEYLSELAGLSGSQIIKVHLITDFDPLYRGARLHSKAKYLDTDYYDGDKSPAEALKIFTELSRQYSEVELLRVPTAKEIDDYEKLVKKYGKFYALAKNKHEDLIEARNKLWCELRISSHVVPKQHRPAGVSLAPKATAAPTYNHKEHTLTFLGKVINVPQYSDQEILCQMLFKKSGQPVSKPVEKGDLYEAFGIEPPKSKDAKTKARKKIYSPKDVLNTKIKVATKTDKDLIVINKTLWINPKYL